MASGFPDWLRAFSMLGKDLTGAYQTVVVDELGQLYALVRGIDDDEALHTLLVDDEGQLIMVPRGESGHYLDVDDEGYLTTVIKGKYLEELRTVVLDDEGRLSAFVIDSVDAWSRMLTIGNAELAVRLGSPVAYDRRGQVFFVETFDQEWTKWTLHMEGVGKAGALDPTTCALAGYSVKLTAGTTLGKFSYVLYRRGVLPVGRVGLEFSFAVPGTVNFIFLNMHLDNGVASYYAKFRWYQATNDLQINVAVTGMTSVGTAKIVEQHSQRYNTVKYVVDLSEDEYVRLLFNQQEIDISDRAIHPGAPGARPRITIEAGVYGTGGADEIVYIDDIILTFAEP